MTAVGLAYSDKSPQEGMSPSHYKSDNERFKAAWHVANCTIEDCEICDNLCHEGLVISCDECGKVHHSDWLGWYGEMDLKGCVSVICPECKKGLIA